jgi:hypothetical protein
VNKLAREADIEQSHDVITHERLRVGMSWLAQNFDFTRGDTIVRLIAAIFLIPHIYSKLVGSGTVDFFKAAGFKPPAFWMYVAGAIEASVAMSFLSNMYARYFASVKANGCGILAGTSTAFFGRRVAWRWRSTPEVRHS